MYIYIIYIYIYVCMYIFVYIYTYICISITPPPTRSVTHTGLWLIRMWRRIRCTCARAPSIPPVSCVHFLLMFCLFCCAGHRLWPLTHTGLWLTRTLPRIRCTCAKVPSIPPSTRTSFWWAPRIGLAVRKEHTNICIEAYILSCSQIDVRTAFTHADSTSIFEQRTYICVWKLNLFIYIFPALYADELLMGSTNWISGKETILIVCLIFPILKPYIHVYIISICMLVFDNYMHTPPYTRTGFRWDPRIGLAVRKLYWFCV